MVCSMLEEWICWAATAFDGLITLVHYPCYGFNSGFFEPYNFDANITSHLLGFL